MMDSSINEQAVQIPEDTTQQQIAASFKLGRKQVDVSVNPKYVKIGEDEIAIEDIISVRIEKTKQVDVSTLTINTIKRKTYKQLQRYSYKLKGSSSEAIEQMITQNLASLTNKPKKLFVIVNPISGSGKSMKMFREKAEPIFTEAGISCEIKVTEHGNRHCTEILKNTDLTPYDGVVFCGGDGMYYEVINGLLPNTQKEAGVDYEDPDCQLAPVSIPIGILPTGTGNRVSLTLSGVGFESAVLAIIKGELKNHNVNCVYSGGKFLTFSGFAQYHGYFSDMMSAAQEVHGMGSRLFKLCVNMFKRPRTFEAEIEYLPTEDQNPLLRFDLTPAESELSGWKCLKGQFNGVDQYIAEFLMNTSTLDQDYSSKNSCLIVHQDTTPGDYMKFLFYLIRNRMDKLTNITTMHLCHIKHVRVKLNYQYPEGSPDDEGLPGIEQTLGLDGETIKLPSPDFTVMRHDHILKLFGVSPAK